MEMCVDDHIATTQLVGGPVLESCEADTVTDSGVLLNGSDDELKIPHHVAIIMDGNARWAQKNGLSIAEGHRSGYENIARVTRLLADRGIREVTLFAFSTENWSRPEDEVNSLMDLALEAIERGVGEFHANGVRLRHVGYERRLPNEMLRNIKSAEELTKDNTAISLNLAFDYGGRHEIVNAVKTIIANGVAPEDVDETLIESHLFTRGIPDPDIVIRTGGEFRISNFMIWQSAYAEFFSCPALWPEFGESEIDEAIKAYSQRQRRFGRRPDQKR